MCVSHHEFTHSCVDAMLYADKNALRTQLKLNMLRIRERELSYYTNNCLAISTSAALLAGFAWCARRGLAAAALLGARAPVPTRAPPARLTGMGSPRCPSTAARTPSRRRST